MKWFKRKRSESSRSTWHNVCFWIANYLGGKNLVCRDGGMVELVVDSKSSAGLHPLVSSVGGALRILNLPSTFSLDDDGKTIEEWSDEQAECLAAVMCLVPKDGRSCGVGKIVTIDSLVPMYTQKKIEMAGPTLPRARSKEELLIFADMLGGSR